MSREGAAILAEADPVMGELIERIGPIALEPRRVSPYQSLVQAIVYQQLSGKAADTIFGRFKEQVGGGVFPTPAQVLAAGPERLRAAGLSKSKAVYVTGVAEQAATGKLPTLEECDRREDGDLIEQLTEIKGIGRWTVEMFLIFNLGRPDVLPVHDLGVRRGYQVTYGKRQMPKPAQLERIGKRWAPWRTLAARYLWRAAD